jgi:hypothetical protein
MRNRYPGNCLRCSKHVAAGAGFFQRVAGRWLVRCRECVGKGNAPVGAERAKTD